MHERASLGSADPSRFQVPGSRFQVRFVSPRLHQILSQLTGGLTPHLRIYLGINARAELTASLLGDRTLRPVPEQAVINHRNLANFTKTF